LHHDSQQCFCFKWLFHAVVLFHALFLLGNFGAPQRQFYVMTGVQGNCGTKIFCAARDFKYAKLLS